MESLGRRVPALFGLAVDGQLRQHRAVGVVERRGQVHRSAVGTGRAAQALAVDRDRTPTPRAAWPPPVGQPRADRGVQGVTVEAAQRAAHRGLVGGMAGSGQRVPAGTERGQDRLGRVSGPLGDGGQGAGAGPHRRRAQSEHAAKRVPPAPAVTGAWDRGEAFQQAGALGRSQRRSTTELGQDRRDRR